MKKGNKKHNSKKTEREREREIETERERERERERQRHWDPTRQISVVLDLVVEHVRSCELFY